MVLSIVTAVSREAYAASPTSEEMDAARRWVAAKLESESPDPPFAFTYGGRPSRELLGTWELEQAEQQLDDQRTQRVLAYRDPETGLQVRCEVIQYANYPAVDWVIYLENTGDGDTPIVEDIQALDTEFTREGPQPHPERRWTADGWETVEILRDPGEFIVHHAQGGHTRIDAFEPLDDVLGPGQELSIGGYSSESRLPFFNVEWPGGGVIGGIGWTAPWTATFARDEELSLRVTAGMSESHFFLRPGERVRMPRLLTLFWKEDRIHGHNVWRRLLLDHYSPRPGGELIQVPTGGATEWHTEEQNIAYINWYAENQFPIEYFWMDIGWSRPPTEEEEAAGIYSESVANEEMTPNGMRAIADAAHEHGIKYVLWFGGPHLYPNPHRIRRHQPELLTEEYPGWDHSNPMVNQWLIDRYSKLIDEWGIDIFRQDTRTYPRPDASEDRIGINWARCAEGNYAFWDALLERSPGLIIDICGGGGFNIDIEAMQRTVTLWRTDFQCAPSHIFDPRGVQAQTYGISFWVPLTGGSARHRSPYPYGFRSGYAPGLQLNWGRTPWPPTEDQLDYGMAHTLLDEFLAVRHCFYGDYYPLTPYSLAPEAWIAWQFDRPDLGEGLVQAFRRPESDVLTVQHRLRGLVPDARYELSSVDLPETTTMTGRELMEEGLPVTITDRPEAVVISYRIVA